MTRTSVHRAEDKALIERLREGRVEAGLTQAAVAAAMDRPHTWLSDVETGIRRLDPVELLDLCELLGWDVVTLVQHWSADVRPKPRKKKLKAQGSSVPRCRG